MKNRFDKYNLGLCIGNVYDFADKSRGANNHASYMLMRAQSMFRYSGLPDTIPQRILELYLQVNGHCCFYEYENNLYVFTGGLGGEPDVYYMPTIYTIANPALKISKNLRINEDCIVVKNDDLYMGLMPMFDRYSTALMENELSMNIASINARIIATISAGDDRTAQSARQFLKDVADGKIGVIAENSFLEGVKCLPYGTAANNALTNLIEYEQYLKASWYNELGLNANYNMKRESINSGESQLNNDMLLPLVDNMLACRKLGLEQVNKMFGTNITIELASSWEDNQIEIDEELANINDNSDQEVGDNDE